MRHNTGWESLAESDCFAAVLRFLDCTDICNLSAACKTLKPLINKNVSSSRVLARHLIKSLLQKASTARDSGPGCSQRVAWLNWVLEHANIPPQRMQQDTQQYLSIPGVPSAMAERLVRAGARITYQQLVSAARDRVDGCWNWIMAMRQQGALTDMPAAVQAIANGAVTAPDPSGLDSETPESLEDLLFAAVSAVGRSPAPDIIGRIVLAQAAQQIDFSTAVHLLKACIHFASNTAAEQQRIGRCFKHLLQLPAFNTFIEPELLNELLHMGLQQGMPVNAWAAMARKLGASNLSCSKMSELLEPAIVASMRHSRQPMYDTYLRALIRLRPGYWSQQFRVGGGSTLQTMFELAIQALDSSTVSTSVFEDLAASTSDPWRLLETARGQLSTNTIVDLLQKVAEASISKNVGPDIVNSCFTSIYKLPASADSKQLLLQAVTVFSSRDVSSETVHICLQSICELPAAATLAAEDAKQLLLWAVVAAGSSSSWSSGISSCLSCIISLPAAAELTASDLKQPLWTAMELKPVTRPAYELCVGLSHWQPDCVDTALAGKLLQAAITVTQVRDMFACFLSCNDQEVGKHALDLSDESSAYELHIMLSALPAVVRDKLDADTIAKVILALVTDSRKLQVICQLRAAQNVSRAAMTTALAAAVAAGNADSVCCLTELKAAAGIDAAGVGAFIRAALQVPRRDFRLVYFLCQLRGAKELRPQCVLEFLRQAVVEGDPLDVQCLSLLPAALQLGRVDISKLAAAARERGCLQIERALAKLQAQLPAE